MPLSRSGIQRAFDFLKFRSYHYKALFGKNNPAAQVVLADLAKFCRANESTFHPNPEIAKRLDGRREVWLRVTQHLHMTPEQLLALYGKDQFQIVRGDDNDDI